MEAIRQRLNRALIISVIINGGAILSSFIACIPEPILNNYFAFTVIALTIASLAITATLAWVLHIIKETLTTV